MQNLGRKEQHKLYAHQQGMFYIELAMDKE